MELRRTSSPEEGIETDSKEPRATLWSILKDFCDYTSAHGFGRIKASKHWSLTVFWSLLFIGAMTIMTGQVHILYKKYKSRPLTTLIEVETSTVSVALGSFQLQLILSSFFRESPTVTCQLL